MGTSGGRTGLGGGVKGATGGGAGLAGRGLAGAGAGPREVNPFVAAALLRRGASPGAEKN